MRYFFIQKDLKTRQRRWLKLAKNYDCVINYHPRKANVIADALSKKSTNLATLSTVQRLLYIELQKFEYEMILKILIRRLATPSLQPNDLKSVRR